MRMRSGSRRIARVLALASTGAIALVAVLVAVSSGPARARVHRTTAAVAAPHRTRHAAAPRSELGLGIAYDVGRSLGLDLSSSLSTERSVISFGVTLRW